MTSQQRSALIRFHKKVRKHTHDVRHRFSSVGVADLEDVTPEEQVVVLVEEVGKLSRAVNKLRIATDPDARQGWVAERDHRLVTVASVAARIASSTG
ncbi:MAG: hypothetical protein OXG79_12720 [Chloroflexi bacterium]|nr:hypothetical protein [Chloroflexota bacterium]